jgi:hypothetical protein
MSKLIAMKAFIPCSLIILTLAFLTYCSGNSPDQSAVHKDSVIVSQKSYKTLLNDPIIYRYLVDTTKKITMECTRGAAEPVLKKTIFPSAEFKLLADKITGIECTPLNDNNLLFIKNWGCESYALSFTFVIHGDSHDTGSLNYWYKKAILLMNQISNGVDAPIDIWAGVDSLQSHINAISDTTKLKIDKEIDYGTADMRTCEHANMRTYIVLDDIKKTENFVLLTVSVVIGPL